MPAPVIEASDAFLRELDAGGKAAVKRMLRHYAQVERQLKRAVARLEIEMASLEAPTSGQLYLLDRYHELLQQTAVETSRLGRVLAKEVERTAGAAADLGAQAGIDSVIAATGGNAVIRGVFSHLDTAGIARAAGFVQPGSPLRILLEEQYGTGWAQVIAEQYVAGVAQGWNPRRIARALTNTVESAIPSMMENTIRTAQLWTYRATNHEAWRRSGLVGSWTWHSALDRRTCGSCWAMHGTVHNVRETLNDHHRGRCAMIPHVKAVEGYPGYRPDVPSGESVFRELSPSKQASIAKAGGWGPQYRAWKAGAIRFDQMPGETTSKVYGKMRGLQPLARILDSQAAKLYYGGGND